MYQKIKIVLNKVVLFFLKVIYYVYHLIMERRDDDGTGFITLLLCALLFKLY